MAIKTKTITQLTELTFTDTDGVYILGAKDNTSTSSPDNVNTQTGKISLGKMIEFVYEKTNSDDAILKATLESKLGEEIKTVNESITGVNTKVTDVEKRVENIEKQIVTPATPKSVEPTSTTCACEKKVATLEAKVAALETTVQNLVSFVQALQKDGYLTLAEIRKAASDACPICNHTHEEA